MAPRPQPAAAALRGRRRRTRPPRSGPGARHRPARRAPRPWCASSPGPTCPRSWPPPSTCRRSSRRSSSRARRRAARRPAGGRRRAGGRRGRQRRPAQRRRAHPGRLLAGADGPGAGGHPRRLLRRRRLLPDRRAPLRQDQEGLRRSTSPSPPSSRPPPSPPAPRSSPPSWGSRWRRRPAAAPTAPCPPRQRRSPHGPRPRRRRRAAVPARRGAWSPLVQIQAGGGAERPAFFCVHGAGATSSTSATWPFASAPDQPFFGLQARGVDGKLTPLTRVEEMAALYLSEIRRVQPHGPYLLGGYSGGGVIAFEMARQLRQQGEETAFLGLHRHLLPDAPHPAGHPGQLAQPAPTTGSATPASCPGRRADTFRALPPAGARIKLLPQARRGPPPRSARPAALGHPSARPRRLPAPAVRRPGRPVPRRRSDIRRTTTASTTWAGAAHFAGGRGDPLHPRHPRQPGAGAQRDHPGRRAARLRRPRRPPRRPATMAPIRRSGGAGGGAPGRPGRPGLWRWWPGTDARLARRAGLPAGLRRPPCRSAWPVSPMAGPPVLPADQPAGLLHPTPAAPRAGGQAAARSTRSAADLRPSLPGRRLPHRRGHHPPGLARPGPAPPARTAAAVGDRRRPRPRGRPAQLPRPASPVPRAGVPPPSSSTSASTASATAPGGA